jgi:hypothetical protein
MASPDDANPTTKETSMSYFIDKATDLAKDDRANPAPA